MKSRVVLFIIFMCVSIMAIGQCPMCRMAAESNLQDGGTAGQGLNIGILYIFLMPYLIVMFFVFIWLKNKKKQKTEDQFYTH